MATFESIKQEADDAFRASKFEQACSLYTQCLEFQPTNGTIYSNRSLCHLKTQQPKKALADAESAIKYRPDWAKAYVRHASALFELGKIQDGLNSVYKIPTLAEPLAPSEYMPLVATNAKKAIDSDSSFAPGREAFILLTNCLSYYASLPENDSDANTAVAASIWAIIYNTFQRKQFLGKDKKDEDYSPLIFATNNGIAAANQWFQTKLQFLLPSAAASDSLIALLNALGACAQFLWMAPPNLKSKIAPRFTPLKSLTIGLNKLCDYLYANPSKQSRNVLEMLLSLIYSLSMEGEDTSFYSKFYTKNVSLIRLLCSTPLYEELFDHCRYSLFCNLSHFCQYFDAYYRSSSMLSTKEKATLPLTLKIIGKELSKADGNVWKQRKLCAFMRFAFKAADLLEDEHIAMDLNDFRKPLIDCISSLEKFDADDGFYTSLMSIVPRQRGKHVVASSSLMYCMSFIERCAKFIRNNSERSHFFQDVLYPTLLRSCLKWDKEAQTFGSLAWALSYKEMENYPVCFEGGTWAIDAEAIERNAHIHHPQTLISLLLDKFRISQDLVEKKAPSQKDKQKLLHIGIMSFVRIFFHLFNLTLTVTNHTSSAALTFDPTLATKLHPSARIRVAITEDESFELTTILRKILNDKNSSQDFVEYSCTIFCYLTEIASTDFLTKLKATGFQTFLVEVMKRYNPVPASILAPCSRMIWILAKFV